MNNKEELIKKISSVISDEMQVHESLVIAAQHMNDSIKRRAVKELQQYTNHYDSLIGRMEELEERRLEVSDAYAKNICNKNHMPLTAIISTIENDADKNTLQNMRIKIKENISILTRLNTANRILLEAALSAITKNFEIMLKTREKFQGYGNSGTVSSRNISRNLLNKIA